MSGLPTPEMTVHNAAWHLGREISVARCPGQAKPMCTLGKIRVVFPVLERKTDGLVHEIVGGRVWPTMQRAGPAGG